MAYRQWQRLHGTRDPGLRDRPQSRPLLHSRSKPGIEWHLRELRQNLQARLCSREPSSGCDHRTPADRRMVRGLQRKPSPLWAQNALPKGVHASSMTIALCPVKRGQLQMLIVFTIIQLSFANRGKLSRMKSVCVERLDLNACDQEPIHLPGSIQYGLLLVVDQDTDVILQVAGDAGSLLTFGGSVLGRTVQAVLGASL